MAREINLIPDIKGEMVKALKIRNWIFFLSFVVAVASVVVVLILGSVVAGQNIAIDDKETRLNAMSAKINSYTDLEDFLTIKDQLGNLETLSSNKNVLSRTFGILSAILPTGADTITISELSINLSGDAPTFSFDAQANAGKAPYIDYNVLDSFKKSMQYLRYDYGKYVDRDGEEIPSYCIVETGTDGAVFSDSEKGNYAYWQIGLEGCRAENDTNEYMMESYDGEEYVRIWRTPQFDEWYSSGKMTAEGVISGIEHFNSKCITYSGAMENGSMKWTSANDSCWLVPKGTDGILVSDSSNGRDSSGELVLRFSAVITLNSDVYNFSKTHMLAIAPSGRHNVTDSYVQVQKMFSERAADCEDGDTACSTTSTEENQ